MYIQETGGAFRKGKNMLLSRSKFCPLQKAPHNMGKGYFYVPWMHIFLMHMRKVGIALYIFECAGEQLILIKLGAKLGV